MKKILFFSFICATTAISGEASSQGLADKEKVQAFSCIKSQSEKYALASCERAVDLVSVVTSACRNDLNKYTDTAFKNPKLKALTLDQRLSMTNQMHAALTSHVPKLVLDARIANSKTCN